MEQKGIILTLPVGYASIHQSGSSGTEAIFWPHLHTVVAQAECSTDYGHRLTEHEADWKSAVRTELSLTL